MTDVLTSLCILIVDDESENIELLEAILEDQGYRNRVTTTDPRRVLALCDEHKPDLLLLDLNMPHLNGLQVLKQLAGANRHMYRPVLVLTGDANPNAKREALATGAKDFIMKPFDATEVLLRVRNLLETRALYKELKCHNELLEHRVNERTQQLATAQLEILDHLALAAEYRDDDTRQHTKRVGTLAALLAQALCQPQEQVELLRLSAPLHDIGKIGVPDRIFLKQGKLNSAEFEIMQSHTTIGAEILGKSNFIVLRAAREIALYHHERWDGTGYPQGLKGEQIPLSARIVAVVDVFDALTHDRPYKKAWPFTTAVAEISKQAGRHFDPHVAQTFVNAITSADLQNLMRNIESQGAPAIPVLTDQYVGALSAGGI